MIHHRAYSGIIDLLAKLNSLTPEPTSKFPDGKLSEDDEGEFEIAIGQENGTVTMAFGKPIAWIGFTPDQAIELADTLKRYARNIQAGQQDQ